MERYLSDAAISEINQKEIKWGHKEKRKADRRVALNSCVDPTMDRRNTIDRRRG